MDYVRKNILICYITSVQFSNFLILLVLNEELFSGDKIMSNEDEINSGDAFLTNENIVNWSWA